MRVVYSNTKPRFHDTRKIASDKWRQRVLGGAAVDNNEDGVTVFSNPHTDFHDTKVKVIQKILNSLP